MNTKERKAAREAESRAREAAAWLDRQHARKAARMETGAIFTQGAGYSHETVRDTGQPESHDLTRGMSPNGTHRQDRASQYHRALIRAWDRDEIQWNPRGTARIYEMSGPDIITGQARGRTEIVPRATDWVPARVKAGAVGTIPAKDRRVDNTISRSAGWSDHQAKAERQFAYESRN